MERLCGVIWSFIISILNKYGIICKLFQINDIENETITVDSYKIIILWFENTSCQYNKAKFLFDMYQIQNTFNMPLAFCRDKQPWKDLMKSIGLTFDRYLFNLKMLSKYQSNYQFVKKLIYIEDDMNPFTKFI